MESRLPFGTRSFDVHVFTDRAGVLQWSFTLPDGTRTPYTAAVPGVVEAMQWDALAAKDYT